MTGPGPAAAARAAAARAKAKLEEERVGKATAARSARISQRTASPTSARGGGAGGSLFVSPLRADVLALDAHPPRSHPAPGGSEGKGGGGGGGGGRSGGGDDGGGSARLDESAAPVAIAYTSFFSK